MTTPPKCFLALNSIITHPVKITHLDNRKLGYIVDCKICGTYEISSSLAASTEVWERNEDRLYVLQAIVRKASDNGNRLSLHTGNVENILDATAVPNTPFEKIDLILQEIQKQTEYVGHTIDLSYSTDYPVAFCRHPDEFQWLIQKAHQLGYLGGSPGRSNAPVTLELNGWQRLDELRRTGKDSDQAFVAMSFDPTLNDIWLNGIKPALEDDTGWVAQHMGFLEHNERIDDRMLAEIRKSGLLIADLTNHRQNVYFEAGFAMGLGIPVIYTCREDEATDDKVHFDTRQYKYIPWTNAADLREQLKARIEATGLAKTLKVQA